ncbi:uncharacterized protein VTP21DRAFT_6733 [Calcarisporiella thermophila]|uniref:uncharacterized protein n=1 Tax=Calcarisporiella thermophila TaxID=911321 RepID=UPI0037438C00
MNALKLPLSMRMALLAITLLLVARFAGANHWMLGDENAIHCYTANSSISDSQQQSLNINGLSLSWVQPIPRDNLSENRLISASFKVSAQPSFYTQNTGVVLPDPTSENFTNLCLRKQDPATGAPACGNTPTSANCCIYHVNLHACRGVFSECNPWIQPTNSTSASNYVLVTHTTSITGALDSVFSFTDLKLPADDWTIIAHIKMLNFQCAIGVKRAVAGNVETPPPTSISNTSGLPAWQIGVIVASAVVGIALLALAAWFFVARRKPKVPKSITTTTIPGSPIDSPPATEFAYGPYLPPGARQTQYLMTSPVYDQRGSLLVPGSPTSTNTSNVPSLLPVQQQQIYQYGDKPPLYYITADAYGVRPGSSDYSPNMRSEHTQSIQKPDEAQRTLSPIASPMQMYYTPRPEGYPEHPAIFSDHNPVPHDRSSFPRDNPSLYPDQPTAQAATNLYHGTGSSTNSPELQVRGSTANTN